ncbi:LysR substrate-binding domain-containing protein [Thalassospira sp.]|uniref:LysR substrate-binding domain-containing protein n=1 Tax=Thalassospira sp. TaxID=1912094 RepID=UPI003AA7ACA8
MSKANIRQIEAFNAVMKVGSVTKAAEMLFVSQPAVTKLLKLFEENCGFALFSRSTGRLVPTAEARQLYSETHKLLAGVARVQKIATSIRNLERGEVSLVAFPAISMQLIPRQVAALIKNREDVNCTLLTRTSTSIEDAMVTRSADFGFSLVPSDNPALKCEKFSELSMLCGLPSDHPLAEKKIISLKDLQNVPLIALGRDDLSFPIINFAFSRLGISMNPVAEVQMSEAACAMVSAGYGVTIVSSLASFGPFDKGIAFRPLLEPIKSTIWLVTPKFEELSKIAVELIETIRTAIIQHEERATSVPDGVSSAG